MDNKACFSLKNTRATQMADSLQRLGHVAPSRLHERGVVALEFALILPLLLTIMLGVIEFGFLMVKYELTASAVASMANEIQSAGAIYSTNVAPAYNTTPAGQQTDANNSGGTFLGFGGAGGAYICAQTYDNTNSVPDNTNALPANPANYCTQGSWVTGGDQALTAPVTSGSYTVAIYAFIPPKDITPFPSLGISTLMLKVAVGKTFQMGGPAAASSGGLTGGCTVELVGSGVPGCQPSTYCAVISWGHGCPFGQLPNPTATADPCNIAADSTHICGSVYDNPGSFFYCECINK
jgi:Flp pilus assembly protein TadG